MTALELHALDGLMQTLSLDSDTNIVLLTSLHRDTPDRSVEWLLAAGTQLNATRNRSSMESWHQARFTYEQVAQLITDSKSSCEPQDTLDRSVQAWLAQDLHVLEYKSPTKPYKLEIRITESVKLELRLQPCGTAPPEPLSLLSVLHRIIPTALVSAAASSQLESTKKQLHAVTKERDKAEISLTDVRESKRSMKRASSSFWAASQSNSSKSSTKTGAMSPPVSPRKRGAPSDRESDTQAEASQNSSAPIRRKGARPTLNTKEGNGFEDDSE